MNAKKVLSDTNNFVIRRECNMDGSSANEDKDTYI